MKPFEKMMLLVLVGLVLMFILAVHAKSINIDTLGIPEGQVIKVVLIRQRDFVIELPNGKTKAVPWKPGKVPAMFIVLKGVLYPIDKDGIQKLDGAIPPV